VLASTVRREAYVLAYIDAFWLIAWVSLLGILLVCRFLGRLHDVAIHVGRRQASEKRQGTKSRLGKV
jgi:hypothetical protein